MSIRHINMPLSPFLSLPHVTSPSSAKIALRSHRKIHKANTPSAPTIMAKLTPALTPPLRTTPLLGATSSPTV